MVDSKGNHYVNVNNARITLVQNRPDESNWAGTKVLRFQAYRESKLHMGAEIPIHNDNDLIKLIHSMLELVSST